MKCVKQKKNCILSYYPSIHLFPHYFHYLCFFLSSGHSCPIPNQHNSGNCVIKENCTEYVKLYTSSISKENINFLQSVQCDNRNTDDETVVCCPKAGKTYESVSNCFLFVNQYKTTKIISVYFFCFVLFFFSSYFSIFVFGKLLKSY